MPTRAGVAAFLKAAFSEAYKLKIENSKALSLK